MVFLWFSYGFPMEYLPYLDPEIPIKTAPRVSAQLRDGAATAFPKVRLGDAAAAR